jgi:hypothetical protein
MILRTTNNPNRAVNGQPINLYVEALVVTDTSIYDDHSRFLNTTDQILIFTHMRMYFAHLIKGVNQRFSNTFANDPDLRINVVLRNFLFLTVNFENTYSKQ